MRLIRSDSTDPAFNLAAEEYLLDVWRQPACMLWRNAKTVVVGRNQNTLAEIDPVYVKERGIRVVRRMTGGGAVYHDLGNVNFTLIEPESMGHINDYAWFTADLRELLAGLGLRAELSGRNDVLLDGKKISGNAQCVRHGLVLHHCCVLFDSDLAVLARALRPDPAKLAGKGIASVASRVANIRGYLTADMDAAAFVDAFARFLVQKYACAEQGFSADETTQIEQIAAQKYGTWAWTYGASPEYNYRNAGRFAFGRVEVQLDIAGGTIRRAHIFGDFFGRRDAAELASLFMGVRHSEEAIAEALAGVNIDAYIYGCSRDTLVSLLLS